MITTHHLIPAFCHHQIPLLPAAGQQGGYTSKAYVAASKDAIELAKRIHGPLRSVGRVETALVPLDSGLLELRPGQSKLRSDAWKAVRDATSLRVIIPTSRPEAIREALPDDWIGKGFQNVCLAGVVDRPDRLVEIHQQLVAVPSHCRMLLFPFFEELPDLTGLLEEIDWVVAVVNSEDSLQAGHVRQACRAANTACLVLPLTPPGAADGACSGLAAQESGEPLLPDHPFGPEVDLQRPTLKDLRQDHLPMSLPTPADPASSPAPAPSPDSADLILAAELPEHPAEDPAAAPSEAPSEAPATLAVAAIEPLEMEVTSTTRAAAKTDLSHNDRRDFVRLDKAVRRGAAAFRECGLALAQIHDRKLWKAGTHATWESYVREVLGMSKPYAHRLVTAARIATHLAESLPIGNDLPRVLPLSESQVRPLCRLKNPELWTPAWDLATERADGRPTPELLRDVVAEMMAEDPVPAAPRPTHKQKLTEIIRLIREANTAPDPRDRVEALLRELEMLLKLSCPPVPGRDESLSGQRSPT